MKKLLFVVFTCFTGLLLGQVNHIIPVPVSAKVDKGEFLMSDRTTIVIGDSGEINSANFLNEYLKNYYGFTLIVTKQKTSVNSILLNSKKNIKGPENDEKYTLKITDKNILISGNSYRGTFYGIQTLLRLLPLNRQTQLVLPAVTVDDYPRFKYRGLHLDVGRHFFPVDFIKKYIDYIALYKLNTFHWHLTEDQGWRIEIKKYPKLTSVGGFRNGTIIGRHPGTGNDSLRYGGFYTQDEIREVVRYAAQRYVTIIPEIELPGHSSAAIAAYPELSCFPTEATKVSSNTPWAGSREGKHVQQTWGVFEDVFCPSENTFTFLQNVLDEVIDLFPSEYIHIGGDESPKDSWKRSEFCQQLIKDKGLKDEHGLQSYFIQRIEKYINNKGRKIIGWDEILEGGLAPNATVMSWRGEQGGIAAAKQKHNVIMTPAEYVYLDYAQSKNEDSVTIGGYLPIEVVYNYEPIPKELSPDEAKYILGAQANVWTEYIKNPRKLEYQVFPRVSALSEVLWSPKEKRNFRDFEKRLSAEISRYNFWKTNYSTSYFDIKSTIAPAATGSILWTLESKSTAPIYVTNNGANTGIRYDRPLVINGPGNYTVALVDRQKVVDSVNVIFSFNKATGKRISLANPPSQKYPGNGGGFGLVNGIRSQTGRRSDEWLGWNNKNLEAFIDLGKAQTISRAAVSVLIDEESRIFLPQALQVYASTDGSSWDQGTTRSQTDNAYNKDGKITVSLSKPVEARYLKIVALNQSAPDSWIFADEIEIE